MYIHPLIYEWVMFVKHRHQNFKLISINLYFKMGDAFLEVKKNILHKVLNFIGYFSEY